VASAQQPGRVLRFGVFEVDLAAAELRKKGLKVNLQDQPFRLLVILLERPGEIVTREELREKLWPADTFVEFDHSLNKAINKIREVLGNSADNPRFVETAPRRGYGPPARTQRGDRRHRGRGCHCGVSCRMVAAFPRAGSPGPGPCRQVQLHA